MKEWLIPFTLWCIVVMVAVAIACTQGCTTITASKGDMSISRTAFGVNLGVPTFIVREAADGTFSLTMRGATSDSTQAIEVAIEGALKGAAMAVKP